MHTLCSVLQCVKPYDVRSSSLHFKFSHILICYFFCGLFGTFLKTVLLTVLISI